MINREIHAPETNKCLFYQQMSIVNGWSVRQLRSQEEAMVYERTLIAAKADPPNEGPAFATRAR